MERKGGLGLIFVGERLDANGTELRAAIRGRVGSKECEEKRENRDPRKGGEEWTDAEKRKLSISCFRFWTLAGAAVQMSIPVLSFLLY